MTDPLMPPLSIPEAIPDDQVWSEMVKWIKKVSGSPTVIRSYETGVRPNLPYIMVNLNNVIFLRDNPNLTHYRERVPGPPPNAIEEATPVMEAEWQFGIQSYGVNPTHPLRRVKSASKLPQLNEELMPKFTVQDSSAISFVPDYVNENWEPRAVMDVNIRGLVTDRFDLDVIEQYSFEFERTQ